MNRLVDNEVILASAGSGKTYQLTNRFIRLLSAGVAPERIIALTFTRKAAGEFLDAIVAKLCAAASDPRKAAVLAEETAGGLGVRADCAYYRELLKRFVVGFPQLQLGTIDSFLYRVVSSFALDLGLSGSFALMDDFESGEVRMDLLRAVLSRAAVHGMDVGDFAEAFRESTYGNEEKSITRMMESFIGAWHAVYLQAPDAEAWGNTDRLGLPDAPGATEVDAALATLAEEIERNPWTDGARKSWRSAIQEVRDYQPIGGKGVRTLLQKAGEIWANEGAVRSIKIGKSKERELSPAESAAVGVILRHLLWLAVRARAVRTRGIHRIMRLYEQLYAQRIRRRGRLTFADLPLVLGNARLHAAPGTADAADAAGDVDELRLFIDYRLDARFDHWMIDEFQDTSRVQWRVFENLIDEVVQDTSGERSFFYVGDVKQSIYGWRGGDARLFNEIREHYGADLIKVRPLHDSWRSVAPVLDMVNRVFSNFGYISDVFGCAVADAWKKVWADHGSRVRGDGFAGVTIVPEGSEDDSPLNFTVLRMLQELRPHTRGLSCAVLVRDNRHARELVDYIRLHGAGAIPVAGELDVPVATDNPVGAALVSWLRAAVHPDDTLASGHLAMTPLRVLCAAQGWRLAFLADLAEQGFERALEPFFQCATQALDAGDGFSAVRIGQLREAARLFDAQGARSVDAFVRYLESHTLREGSSDAVVQVMTVHKSKGLGFDVVILPQIHSTKSINKRRPDKGVAVNSDGEVEWVLDYPDEFACKLCPTLALEVEKAREQLAFEELCNLYVAMTRAKRGLYVVTPEQKDTSKVVDHRAMLRASLPDGYSASWAIDDAAEPVEFVFGSGSVDWYAKVEPKVRDVEPAAAPALVPETAAPAPERAPVLPSDHDEEAATVQYAFFGIGRHHASALGNTVHDIFAAIEWIEGDVATQLAAARAACNPVADALWREAVAMVQACMDDSVTRGVFERRADARVWRERAFDVIGADGEWTSGVMDRVELQCDANGNPVAALITDFKTDVIDMPERKTERIHLYASQLAGYRTSLARLLSLPADAIRCQLLFVRDRSLVQV